MQQDPILLWSLSRQCNGAEVDEVQKFLTFNFIIFRVDSLRAGGWWCSLEPVQLLQLSRKMWRMVKNAAALHSALTSSQLTLHSLQLQSPTRDHFMVSSETRSLVACYNCQNTMMYTWAPLHPAVLHPGSLSEQIKLWHSMFNFTRAEPQPITGQLHQPSSPACQGGINIVEMRRVSTQ